jgi:hypothetical protein
LNNNKKKIVELDPARGLRQPAKADPAKYKLINQLQNDTITGPAAALLAPANVPTEQCDFTTA